MVYLDDRPVIDQIIEPTPEAIVEQARDDADNRVTDGYEGIREQIWNRVLDALTADLGDVLNPKFLADLPYLDEAVDHLAGEISEHIGEALSNMADEIMVRLP